MKLLVPVDGSVAAYRAVIHALWLAQGRPGSRIVLVNVQNRQTLGLSDIDVAERDDKDVASRRSQKALRNSIKACEAAGIPFEARAEFGPICETIIRIAHEIRADQIVMGTRGLGRVSGLLLGSVATAIIHAANIPVTLVKRSTRSSPIKRAACGIEAAADT